MAVRAIIDGSGVVDDPWRQGTMVVVTTKAPTSAINAVDNTMLAKYEIVELVLLRIVLHVLQLFV